MRKTLAQERCLFTQIKYPVYFIFFVYYIMSLKQRSMVGTRSNSWTNRPQGGGPKLSGLPNALSSAGVGMMFGRTYRGGPAGLLANYKNKNQVFCINQIGGIGAHGGGRSLFKMMDGLDCKGGGITLWQRK